MIIKDDRTDEQRITHNLLVIGTDRFLSGWGGAEGGLSYAAWACKEKDIEKVYEWVKQRKDMMRVRWAEGNYKPRGCIHLHIYVVNDNHPALGG